MKYNKIVMILIILLVTLFISCPGPGGETEEPPLLPQPGDAWFVPDKINAHQDDLFITEVHVNTGEVMIGAYGFFIYFDEAVIAVDETVGTTGVDAGSDGFLLAVNPTVAGELKITGFDESGKGPGTDLHIVTIHWTASGTGTSDLEFDIDVLTNEIGEDIGNPLARDGFDGEVTIN